ncbi:MAG: LPS-assembly protein LptD [Bacteroidales bacterium]|nr:LPS-assembly protein LptD [Bacteroidales bacterium]
MLLAFVLATIGGVASAQSPLPLSPNALTDVVHYKSKDSITLQVKQRKAHLHSEGVVEYENMELQADQVEVDFNRQTMQAHGSADSAGKVFGRPLFKQGENQYYADTIVYNYNSQKGIISGVITQEGDGFLHGSKVKRMNDSVMYLNKGQYTTCNYVHPHFAINFSKSKLIAGDKIITGPAYLSIEDVPTPLVLPFAFFPLNKGRSSGLIMPSYGWMNGRGYYLKDGGYYMAFNDYMDLTLMGEVYTNLSWTGEVKSQYYRRYKHKGSFDIRYGRTKEGIRGDTANYKVFSDFKVAWRHDQDAKKNPYSRFSADVNLVSRNYNKNTTVSSDYFNATSTSSISYTAQLGRSLNLAASARESYNVRTGLMNIQLPSISLSSVTFYPLRRKVVSGGYKWYENISMSYQFAGANNLNEQDSNILKRSVLDKMQYGIQHSVPIQSNVKVLKYFNWTNSVSYHERWHWSTIDKHIDEATGALVIDTVRGFRSNRDVSYTSSLSTRIYGMFNFRYGPMKALRHVVNPTLSFRYQPDFGKASLGYWKQYTDTTGYVHRYSIFEQSLYGGPSDGRSGQVAFSVGNNLEMKWKPLLSKKNAQDTATELKKITLIENLNLGMSYDVARDSLNWSDLSVSGRTTLFRSFQINYSGSFIPYVVDSLGNKHNQLLWNAERRLFQKSNSTWSTQLSWSLNNATFKKKGGNEKSSAAGSKAQLVPPIFQTPYNYDPALMTGSYVDFSVPWNLSISYTLSYVSRYVAQQFSLNSEVVQSLSLSGSLSLTENWKVSFSTGYDFANKGMSYTSVDIYRDLHCWEMRFNWVPFGYYKSWNFSINIKADSLHDVKWEKKQPYQDGQGYYTY